MPTPPLEGRAPTVFDYGWYAFLTDASPVTELVLLRHGQQARLSTGTDRFTASLHSYRLFDCRLPTSMMASYEYSRRKP